MPTWASIAAGKGHLSSALLAATPQRMSEEALKEASLTKVRIALAETETLRETRLGPRRSLERQAHPPSRREDLL